jgi:hypothetical protein
MFASFLLMPATTVNSGFNRRGWHLDTATPLQVYTVACWLGVGYSTLINHMHYSLRKITSKHAANLLGQTPKNIKKEILGTYCHENVVPVGVEWTGRPVDVFIGDLVLFHKESVVECPALEGVGSANGNDIYRAINTGIGNVYCQKNDWNTFVRVSRSSYNGRGKFRHLEGN